MQKKIKNSFVEAEMIYCSTFKHCNNEEIPIKFIFDK